MKEKGNCIITVPYGVSAPLNEIMSNPELFTRSIGGAYDTFVGAVAGASILNGDKLPNQEIVSHYARGLKVTIYEIIDDLGKQRTNPRGRLRAGTLLKTASAIFTAHAKTIPEINIINPAGK